MNIILGEERAQELREKYTVLELDTFCINNSPPVKSYAIVENIPIPEMFNLDNMVDLHAKMIDQYHQQNFQFCLDALEHLIGRWNSEIDTFYHDLLARINQYQKENPGSAWNSIIHRTQNVSDKVE